MNRLLKADLDDFVLPDIIFACRSMEPRCSFILPCGFVHNSEHMGWHWCVRTPMQCPHLCGPICSDRAPICVTFMFLYTTPRCNSMQSDTSHNPQNPAQRFLDVSSCVMSGLPTAMHRGTEFAGANQQSLEVGCPPGCSDVSDKLLSCFKASSCVPPPQLSAFIPPSALPNLRNAGLSWIIWIFHEWFAHCNAQRNSGGESTIWRPHSLQGFW